MPGALGELGVADPLRRDEDDDVEDGRAYREDAPKDGYRPRVSERESGLQSHHMISREQKDSPVR